MAVLRPLPGRARDARKAVVSALRRTGACDGAELPRLPATRTRARASTVRIRRTRPPSRAPAEVLRLAPGRRRARRGDGRGVVGRPLRARLGHLGAVVTCATRLPRLRPGKGSRARGCPQARRASGAPARAGRRSRSTGSAGWRRPSRGDARDVRRCPPPPAAGPAGRRRAHDRRHRRRVRRGAPRRRCGGGRPPRGRPRRLVSTSGCGAGGATYTRRWARVRVCGCPGERFPGSRCQPRAKRPT